MVHQLIPGTLDFKKGDYLPRSDRYGKIYRLVVQVPIKLNALADVLQCSLNLLLSWTRTVAVAVVVSYSVMYLLWNHPDTDSLSAVAFYPNLKYVCMKITQA